MHRLNFQPDSEFEDWIPAIRAQWDSASEENCAAAIRGEGFLGEAEAALFDEIMGGLGAAEGFLWLVDEANESMVIVHANGESAEEIVGQIRHPLSEGVIAMVIATQSGVCESWVEDETADPIKGMRPDKPVAHFAAAPLFLTGETRGVICAVKRCGASAESRGPEPFGENTIPKLLLLAHFLGESLGARYLREALSI